MVSFCDNKRQQHSKMLESLNEEEALNLMRKEQELAKKIMKG